jgi:hypothetical protein
MVALVWNGRLLCNDRSFQLPCDDESNAVGNAARKIVIRMTGHPMRITEISSRMQLVLFGMQHRTVCPYLTVMHRNLIP